MHGTFFQKAVNKCRLFSIKIGRFFVIRFYLFPKMRKLLQKDGSVIFFDAGNTIGDPLQLFSVASVYHRLHPLAPVYLVMPLKKERIIHFYSSIGTNIFYPNKYTKFFISGARCIVRFEYSSEYVNRFFSDIWFLKTPIPVDCDAIDFLAIKRLHFDSDWIPNLPQPPKCSFPLSDDKKRGLVIINKNSELANSSIVASLSIAAHYCEQQGFKVLCNVSGTEKPIEGIEPLSCSLPELYWLSKESAALIISVRSGLLDFLVSAGCPIISVDSNPPVYDKIMPLSMWKTKTKVWSISYPELSAEFIGECLKSLKR